MKRTVRIACSAVAVLFLIINGTNLLLSQTPDLATKLRLAQGLEQSGEFERAATLYNELLSRDPSNYLYFDGLQRMLSHAETRAVAEFYRRREGQTVQNIEEFRKLFC